MKALLKRNICYRNLDPLSAMLLRDIEKGVFMYTIDVLERDHKNIVAFTDFAQDLAISIMEGGPVDRDLLRRMVSFIRTYCDHYHHQKEEDFLFKRMIEDLGDVALKLVNYGMMAEHNMARKHVLDLEMAIEAYEMDPGAKNRLEIISFLMAYVHLLRDHADKENKVVYPFALKHLSKEAWAWVDKETKKVEEGLESQKIYQDFQDFIPYKGLD